MPPARLLHPRPSRGRRHVVSQSVSQPGSPKSREHIDKSQNAVAAAAAAFDFSLGRRRRRRRTGKLSLLGLGQLCGGKEAERRRAAAGGRRANGRERRIKEEAVAARRRSSSMVVCPGSSPLLSSLSLPPPVLSSSKPTVASTAAPPTLSRGRPAPSRQRKIREKFRLPVVASTAVAFKGISSNRNGRVMCMASGLGGNCTWKLMQP